MTAASNPNPRCARAAFAPVWAVIVSTVGLAPAPAPGRQTSSRRSTCRPARQHRADRCASRDRRPSRSLHDRQPGAHLAGPAEDVARPASRRIDVAPASRHGPRRRGQRPHAPGDEPRRLLPYQTRVAGNTIVVNIGSVVAVDAAAAGSAGLAWRRRADRRRRAGRPRDPEASTSVAARGHGPADRRLSTIRARRSTCASRKAAIVVDFPAHRCRFAWFAASTWSTSRRRSDLRRGPRTGRAHRPAATGDFEQLAYQSDDHYVVEVQPARKAQIRRPTRSQPTPASASR